MAKIRGLELPADYNECLVEYVKGFSDDIMARIGRDFLPGRVAHAHLARDRIAAVLRSPVEIEVWLYSVLEQVRPGKQCFENLSLKGLKLFITGNLKLWPGPHVVLPLLLDPRKEVQHFGAELVTRSLASDPVKLDEATQQNGREEIVDFVNNCLLSVAGLEANIGPMHPAPRRIVLPDGQVQTRQQFIEMFGDMTKTMGKMLKEQKQLIRNLEEQRSKHKTRLETITREAAEEKKRLLTERDQALSKARRAEKEKATLTERMHRAEARVASEISCGVAGQTSAVLRKWLQAPLAIEQAAHSAGERSDDVLARAGEMLQKQAAQDPLAGIANELGDRLAKLETTKLRLTATALTALRPLPELGPLLREIEEQIQCVRKTLGMERALDPITQRLLITINQGANPEHALASSRLIEQSADMDLVPRGDRRRLMDALQRKFSLLEELAHGQRLSVTDPGWALRGVIHRDQPSLLLLDGFNILFGMEEHFRSDYAPDGRPGRRAAEKLIAILRRFAEARKNLRIRLVLDSPHHQVTDLMANLAVEYSGGTGQHRADQRIAELLEFRRPEEMEEKWFVISDDHEVRRNAVLSQAQPVMVDVFNVLLDDYGFLRKETASPGLASQAA